MAERRERFGISRSENSTLKKAWNTKVPVKWAFFGMAAPIGAVSFLFGAFVGTGLGLALASAMGWVSGRL